MSKAARIRTCTLGLLFVATNVSAQNIPIPKPSNSLEIFFSNPGARSLGLGGAFVALADDATAAFANPAGLAQLIKPEFSIEGRHWSFSTPFTAGGRAAGQPTGLGLDTTSGLRKGESTEDVSDISFLSYVYARRNWSLALYRHQLANFESTTETEGLFGEVPPTLPTFRAADQRTAVNVAITSYGLAGAYSVAENLFLGVGISYFEGDLASRVEGFKYCSPLLSCVVDANSIFDANSFAPENLIFAGTFADNSSDWGFNVGILWHFLEQWVLGTTYREGAEFGFDIELRSGPGFEPLIPDGTIARDISGSGLIRFPDVFSLGIAFKPSDALRISAEWDRVNYSSIVDSTFRNLLGEDLQPFDIEDLTVDDGSEYHLGVEYTFVKQAPIVAIRLGAWLDPDHRVRHEGDEQFNRALFQQGDDEMHYAAGIGIKFNRFQIDLGFDVSDLVDTGSVSMIYQF